MEDQIKKQIEQRVETEKNKLKQVLCKSSDVTIKWLKAKKNEKFPYKLEVDNCKNNRRNGSAWCQKCSDEYKSNL